VGKNTEQRKIELNIIHNKPNLQSLILVKAVLLDQSSFNFTGNLIINKGAKYTDTYLKVAILMLSKSARAQAVPCLEIMENDVKGGHGATIRMLDPEEIFYLVSRGLTIKESTKLLVKGFLEDVTRRLLSPEQKAFGEKELAKLI